MKQIEKPKRESALFQAKRFHVKQRAFILTELFDGGADSIERQTFGHYDDTFGRDGEAFGVKFGVVADGGSGGNFDVFVDNGAPDFAVTPDFDIVEQN